MRRTELQGGKREGPIMQTALSASQNPQAGDEQDLLGFFIRRF